MEGARKRYVCKSFMSYLCHKCVKSKNAAAIVTAGGLMDIEKLTKAYDVVREKGIKSRLNGF